MATSVTDCLSLDSNISMQPHSLHSLAPGRSAGQHLNPPFSSTEMLLSRGNITPQIVENVEAELDFYEKVSMVFLLYSDVDVALQRLKVAEIAERTGSLSQSDLLSLWARSQSNDSIYWEEMFLEALCIIQNYEVVEKLGYKKCDVVERFLPDNPETALTVDLMRKALYVICEKLTYDQSKELIHLVKQDLECEFPSQMSQEPDFLEMHFLYWMSQQHILIQNQRVDVKCITKHLKVMDKLNLADYLESISKRYRSHVNPSNDDATSECSGVFSGSLDNHSVVSSTDCHQEVSTGDRYYIDPKNVGYCFIINQKNFTRDPDPRLRKHLSPDILEDRMGTDVDRDRLIEAFFNLGFKIHMWNNLSHIEMKNEIKTAIEQLVQDRHSCFVLCILSHGKRNAVYGVNSIPIYIDEIEELLNGKYCPKLLDKPKVLIIQACQGQETQDAISVPNDTETDGPPHSRQTVPGVSNLLTWWSTVPGFASFRNALTGTWFIQTLCDQLLTPLYEVDILKVGINVNSTIQNKTAVLDGEIKCMQPQFNVTLGKQLILPCSREARTTVVERITYRHLFDVMLDQYLEREFHDQFKKMSKKDVASK